MDLKIDKKIFLFIFCLLHGVCNGTNGNEVCLQRHIPTPRTPLSEHLWQAATGGGLGKRHR